MNKVEIFEQELTNQNKIVGKLVILRVGLNTEAPTAIIDKAVSDYVGENLNNQFVDIHTDNPYVRIVIKGMNELEFVEFTNQVL